MCRSITGTRYTAVCEFCAVLWFTPLVASPANPSQGRPPRAPTSSGPFSRPGRSPPAFGGAPTHRHAPGAIAHGGLRGLSGGLGSLQSSWVLLSTSYNSILPPPHCIARQREPAASHSFRADARRDSGATWTPLPPVERQPPRASLGRFPSPVPVPGDQAPRRPPRSHADPTIPPLRVTAAERPPEAQPIGPGSSSSQLPGFEGSFTKSLSPAKKEHILFLKSNLHKSLPPVCFPEFTPLPLESTPPLALFGLS